MLPGATAFYAARGDPAAFVEIKRHFDDVFAAVRARRGAVVKTIGDAVMATFGDPVDALRAAADIHRAFPPGRADSPIRVRVSLNTGSCIAVRLNANIDYFGGTVNVAEIVSVHGSPAVSVSDRIGAQPTTASPTSPVSVTSQSRQSRSVAHSFRWVWPPPRSVRRS